MKNFVIALILLLLTAALVLVNARLVRREVDGLKELLREDGNEKGKARKLCAILEEKEFFFSLSSNHLIWEQAVQLAGELSVYEDDPEKEKETKALRKQLALILSELEDGEKFSFITLFRLDFFPKKLYDKYNGKENVK